MGRYGALSQGADSMQIVKIELQNFRSHRSTKLDLGELTMVSGQNNSGKSTIADAIEFALTGRCRGTDEGGKGAASLIATGEKQAAVTIELRSKQAQKGDNARLTRTVTPRGVSVELTHGKRTYIGAQVQEFLDEHGYDKDVLTAALRVGRFFDLRAGDQKELLATLLKPDAVKMPEDLLQDLIGFGAPVDAEELTLEELREIHDSAVATRAECSAVLKVIGEPVAPQWEPGAPKLADVNKQLGDLRRQQNAKIAEQTRIADKWDGENQRRLELPQIIKGAKTFILDEETEQKAIASLAHETERTAAAAALTEINRRVLETEKELKKPVPEKCPTCGAAFDGEAHYDRLHASLKADRSRIPALTDKLNAYYESGQARDMLRQHRTAATDLERHEKELKALGVATELPMEVEALQKEIDALEERIEKGQAVASKLSALQNAQDTYEVAMKEHRTREEQREAADKVAKWAGPNGAQAQITDGKLPAFVNAINKTLEAFGYGCNIEMEPYRISVRRVGGDQSFELALLSESELWRFSMGFQSALAKASGVNLAVFDRADVLISDNRETALRTLASAGLDQAIVIASTEAKPKLPPIFTVFNLTLSNDGQTQVD